MIDGTPVVIVAGGLTVLDYQDTDLVEAYKLDQDTWVQLLDPLPVPLAGSIFFNLWNFIILITGKISGGSDSNNFIGYVSSLERFIINGAMNQNMSFGSLVGYNTFQ